MSIYSLMSVPLIIFFSLSTISQITDFDDYIAKLYGTKNSLYAEIINVPHVFMK